MLERSSGVFAEWCIKGSENTVGSSLGIIRKQRSRGSKEEDGSGYVVEGVDM